MSAAEEVVEQKKPLSLAERPVKYKPLGSNDEIELTVAMVKKFLVVPTKSKQYPTDEDIVKFIMLNKARGLNPWEGDSYLTGYDTNDGPQFSLITAIQALLKRAEVCPEFDGVESGICVLKKDGEVIERNGSLLLAGENLIGGWAKVYRKDRKIPSYSVVAFNVYNTDRSRWKKDPAGMIQKVAKAHSLREAFPNHLAGLRTDDEMERVVEGSVVHSGIGDGTAKAKTAAELAEVLKIRNAGEQVNPISMFADSARHREQFMAEIQSASNFEAIESIMFDIHESEDLSPVDRSLLERAIRDKRNG
jgi:phage recombination protein Bet